MKNNMKKIGLLMSLYMGLTISFGLSLLCNIVSPESFDIKLFFITFTASFVISLLIGIIVPMGKIGHAATKNLKKPNGFGAKCLESLISDLIYTPIITLAMIALVRKMVPILINSGTKHLALLGGASEEEAVAEAAVKAAKAVENFPPFIIQLLPSLGLCLAVGFVLILIFQPLYMKALMKKFGPPAPAGNEVANNDNTLDPDKEI